MKGQPVGACVQVLLNRCRLLTAGGGGKGSISSVGFGGGRAKKSSGEKGREERKKKSRGVRGSWPADCGSVRFNCGENPLGK